jgi:hypothetical protein
MNRNFILVPAIAMVAVAACSTTQQQATLEQTKVWVTAVSNALASAATQYTGPNKAQVMDALAKLQTAAAEFANIGDVSTARTAVQSVLSLAQQLVPLVSVALGPNAVYVSMGLAVIQAFIAALPIPPTVAPSPPASLLAPVHAPAHAVTH